jgi:hypothetical protein
MIIVVTSLHLAFRPQPIQKKSIVVPCDAKETDLFTKPVEEVIS